MKHPFTAVAIRYVHDPRTEEFLNIGLVLFCEGHRFAGARFLSRWGRVTAAFVGADLTLLRRMARAIERASEERALVMSTQLDLEPVRDALAILEDTVRSQANVLTEDRSDALVAKIEADLRAHESADESIT